MERIALPGGILIEKRCHEYGCEADIHRSIIADLKRQVEATKDDRRQALESAAEIARNFAQRWYEQGEVYLARHDAYGDYEHSFCRARGDSCMAVSGAIMELLHHGEENESRKSA